MTIGSPPNACRTVTSRQSSLSSQSVHSQESQNSALPQTITGMGDFIAHSPYDGVDIENCPPDESEGPSSGPSSLYHLKFPEGGRAAWLCVLGSCLGSFVALGFMNMMGSLLSYLETSMWVSDAGMSSDKIGWIGGLFAFISFFLGIQVGPLFDKYGARYLLIVGNGLIVIAAFAMGQCTKYWHFIVAYSIVGGAGTSIVFCVGPSCVSHWFYRKRGIAAGVAVSGGAAGGIILPIAFRIVSRKYGFPWAMRTLGIIFTVAGLGSIWLCTSRHKEIQQLAEKRNLIETQRCCDDKKSTISAAPTNSSIKKPRFVFIDFKSFRDLRFTFLVCAIFFMELSLFIPMSYIGTFGITYDIGGHGDDSFGWWIFAIAYAGSGIGRLVTGFLADIWGPFNVMLGSILFTTAALFVLWLPSYAQTSLGVYISFGLLWGFGTGAFISLTPVCVGKISDIDVFATRYGTCYFIVSFGCLVGPPVAGALLQTGRSIDQGWIHMIVFTGLMSTASFISLMLSRWWTVGNWRALI
ncbi:MFS general substrate transporter [Nadsonia fulvescens var. elongata DSM 6958]|uniref:MFS general substrate transporter n=1 Tax=Nadsonia fulvescens var. elongata DSM 6958 TaxID=857566 RepID=A0A1E3PDP2_9ASCO|nr:MFS general substrate transporter [Nadsonia fulvescens var. elongata DSM 6958]